MAPDLEPCCTGRPSPDDTQQGAAFKEKAHARVLLFSRSGRGSASVHLTTARPGVAALQVAPAVADVRSAATIDIDRAFKLASPAVTTDGRQNRPFLPDVAAGLLVAAATRAASLSIAVLPAAILSVAVLPVVGAALVRPILVLRIASIPILLELDMQGGLCWGRHQSGSRREGTTQREQS